MITVQNSNSHLGWQVIQLLLKLPDFVNYNDPMFFVAVVWKKILALQSEFD